MRPTVTVRAPRRALAAHSSGRFDRSVEKLERSVRRIRHTTRGRGLLQRKVALVTGTEASGRSAAELERVLGAPNWDYVHIDGRGKSECWATWDTRVLERAGRAYTRQITDRTWFRSPEYGGSAAPFVHALVVPLRVVGRPARRTITVIVVHMPLDNTELRADIWVECTRGLREVVAEIRANDPHTEILIEADWNKNYREADERRMIQHYVADALRLVQAWDGSAPARGGTHGPRALIDGAVASRRLLGATTPWCWLLKDDTSSDHRPYAHALRWPMLPRRIRRRLRKTTRTSKETR